MPKVPNYGQRVEDFQPPPDESTMLMAAAVMNEQTGLFDRLGLVGKLSDPGIADWWRGHIDNTLAPNDPDFHPFATDRRIQSGERAIDPNGMGRDVRRF